MEMPMIAGLLDALNTWNTGIEMMYSESRQKGKNRLSAT